MLRRRAIPTAVAGATAALTLLTLAPPGAGARATKRPVTRPDYSIRFADDEKTVTAGGSVDYSVRLQPNRAFRGAVVFDLPNISDFLTARVVPQGPGQVGLRINVPPNVPAHSGVFVLRGRSGAGLVRDAVFRLTVNRAPVTTTPAPPVTTPAGPVEFGVVADQKSRTATPGATVQYGISVDRRSGFRGDVAFQVQNLPTGTTANFAPNPTSASTVLYVTPGASTPSGTYLITALATAGSTTRATAMELVVRRTGAFGLALAPAAVIVGAGNDAVAAVNVTAPRGSSAPAPDVDLSVQGLPAGVQAIFTPNPSNGIAQLRLTTLPTVAPGAYNATVVGTSGSARQSVPLRLTVRRNVPSFGFQAQPTTVTVAPGATAVYTIAVTRAAGFDGPITVAVRGLPPQSSPSVEQSGNRIVVRVTTSAATPAGAYTLQFTGTSGALQATVVTDLVVRA